MHLEGCCFVPQHLGHLIRHLKDQGRPIHFLHLWLFRAFIKEGSLWMKNIHPSSEKTSSFKLFHDYKKTDLVTIFIVYQKYMQYFNFFHLLPLDVLSWFDIKFKFYSTNIIMHYSWYLKISGYSYDWELKYIGTCTVCFPRSGKLFNPKYRGYVM